MKHLYFIRHGESEFNKSLTWSGSSDTPLTENGREQAKEAGVKAKEAGLKVDLIISSPLSRAQETAKIFAQSIGYDLDEIILDKNTVERNFGELEGHKDLVAGTKYIYNESAIDNYKGVEKLKDLQNRADKFWVKLQSHPQDTILLAGHGAFLRALRRSILQIPISERGNSFKNGELIKII